MTLERPERSELEEGPRCADEQSPHLRKKVLGLNTKSNRVGGHPLVWSTGPEGWTGWHTFRVEFGRWPEYGERSC